ncbi:hypothetical protein Tco_1013583, partial [Tanacetum coccineum]
IFCNLLYFLCDCGLVSATSATLAAAPASIMNAPFDETKEQKNETRRTNLALWDSRRLKVKP